MSMTFFLLYRVQSRYIHCISTALEVTDGYLIAINAKKNPKFADDKFCSYTKKITFAQ
jgi:hypothetical protein